MQLSPKHQLERLLVFHMGMRRWPERWREKTAGRRQFAILPAKSNDEDSHHVPITISSPKEISHQARALPPPNFLPPQSAVHIYLRHNVFQTVSSEDTKADHSSSHPPSNLHRSPLHPHPPHPPPHPLLPSLSYSRLLPSLNPNINDPSPRPSPIRLRHHLPPSCEQNGSNTQNALHP